MLGLYRFLVVWGCHSIAPRPIPFHVFTSSRLHAFTPSRLFLRLKLPDLPDGVRDLHLEGLLAELLGRPTRVARDAVVLADTRGVARRTALNDRIALGRRNQRATRPLLAAQVPHLRR